MPSKLDSLLSSEFRYFFSISLFVEEEASRARIYDTRETLRAEKVENIFTQLYVLIDMRTV